MKKAALILSLFVFLLLPPGAYAQEFDFAKAYQDFIFTQTEYDQADSDYEQSKNSYLKNPTLTLKEEARKKTLIMLKSRDELFRVYLSALRMKLLEIKFALPPKMDDEISWYKGHKEVYKDDDPLETLFSKSKESKSRFTSDTSFVIYESLFDISFGEIQNIRGDQEKVYSSLKNSIDLGVKEGILVIDPFNRWFTDIDSIITELDAINLKAKAKIAKMYGTSSILPKNSYNSAIADLIPATAKILELNQFLTEFLNAINARLIKP